MSEKELNEDIGFKISLKTLGGVIALVATIIGSAYAYDSRIDSRIDEKVEKIKVGKGFYQIDLTDPAAKETWPPSRQEFDMKDQMTRKEFLQFKEEVDRRFNDLR
jgi:hypothetical protein